MYMSGGDYIKWAACSYAQRGNKKNRGGPKWKKTFGLLNTHTWSGESGDLG